MLANSIGDLSQSFLLRSRNTELKAEMQRLGAELSTGQVADMSNVLSGNLSYLNDIERSLNTLSGFKTATAEATLFSKGVQDSLEKFADLTNDLSGSLLLSSVSAVGATSVSLAADGKTTLDAIINVLNTDSAGRSLFAGNATTQVPLISGDDLIAAMLPALSGATTPADIMTAARDWFNDPSGFDAIAYNGSDTGLSPFAVSDLDRIDLDVRATDPALKDILRTTALTAMATSFPLMLSSGEELELQGLAGKEMFAAKDGLTALQARVGFAQASIEKVAARNAAETNSLEFARNELLAVDPFEAATRLEEVQFQLQSLYSITVKMSQLSLVNYL